MGANEEKKQQLGMSPGTARNKLHRRLMFRLAQECGRDVCHQCGNKIKTPEEFSVEHKEPWLHSGNPVDRYFDLDNIAFSHQSCNYSAARPYRKKTHPGIGAYKRGCRCDECKEIKRKITRESNRRLRDTQPENYRR